MCPYVCPYGLLWGLRMGFVWVSYGFRIGFSIFFWAFHGNFLILRHFHPLTPTTMLKLIDEEHLKQLRHIYQKSRLYCTLYPALAVLERWYGELAPTQVWHEMEVFCAERLMGAAALEMEVIALWNCLLMRYMAFLTPSGQTIGRTPVQAEYTAVCVMTCVCFRLVAEPDSVATWHSTEAVKEILKLIAHKPLHCHLYNAQRQREKALEAAGRPIERIPWVNGVDARRARIAMKKAAGGGTKEQEAWARTLLRHITLTEWKALVCQCEQEMHFQHKIDRMAYLVLASHKGWLKNPKTLPIATWVKFMNSLLGEDKKMQQSEVSPKWNSIRKERFYERKSVLEADTTFQGLEFKADFYERLKENVLAMHQIADSTMNDYTHYDKQASDSDNPSCQRTHVHGNSAELAFQGEGRHREGDGATQSVGHLRQVCGSLEDCRHRLRH